jgi:hypothetical protein
MQRNKRNQKKDDKKNSENQIKKQTHMYTTYYLIYDKPHEPAMSNAPTINQDSSHSHSPESSAREVSRSHFV